MPPKDNALCSKPGRGAQIANHPRPRTLCPRPLLQTACVLLLALPLTAPAQFGKNKVQYEQLEWQIHHLPHVDAYYHENQGELPLITARWAEELYGELSETFGFEHRSPVPLLVYGSPILFEQTNVILQVIPEGVGGFTELFKNRVVIPFDGSYRDYRHVLHHELVHAFQFGILFDRFGGSILKNTNVQLPLWFAEGSAEYLSSGWSTEADMFMMDRAVYGGVPLPGPELSGYMAYKGGQSFLHFLASSRGDSTFTKFLNRFRRSRNVESALESTYGSPVSELGEEWLREVKRLYWPEIGRRKDPAHVATALTRTKDSRTRYNLKARISPDGSLIAFFTDAKDYTRIRVTDRDGNIEAEIRQNGYGGYFESFQPFRSGMCWAPDSRRLAFITKNQGRNEIRIVDVKSEKLLRTIVPGLESVSAPDWSPDGERLAFIGLRRHERDIYLYDLATDSLRRLTDDIRAESAPHFSRDGNRIVFAAHDTSGGASSRNPTGRPASDLFVLDLVDLTVRRLTTTPWNENAPVFSPAGDHIAFVDDRNGIDNVYIAPVNAPDSARALTDFIGGCSDPDWARADSTLVFTLFQKQKWHVWYIEDPLSKLIDTLPAPTQWVRSLQDTSIAFYRHVEPPAPDSADSLDDTTGTAAEAEGTKPHTIGITVEDTTAGTTAEETIGDTAVEAVRDSTRHAAGPADTAVGADTAAGGEGRPLAQAPPPDSIDEPPMPIDTDTLSSTPYRISFTPDMVSVGMAIAAPYGYAGEGVIVLSDILGNHRISLAGNAQGSLDQYNLFASYLNAKYRLDMGIGAFHSRFATFTDTIRYYADINTGVLGYLGYPFSTFSRVELNVYYRHQDRIPYIARSAPRRDRARPVSSLNVTLPSLAYTFDNILWGLTGPINGLRARANLLAGIPITANDASFLSFDCDIRRYFHFARRFVWANRLTFGGSVPINRDESARRYFLGGNELWLNYRPNRENYEESAEHWLYSDLVVPFRGWDYFDLTGTRFAVLNTEFRFPFVREIDFAWPLPLRIRYINGAVFCDIGNAWDRADQMDNLPLPTEIYGGIGWGLRVNLGIFVLRYDQAWKTDWREYVRDMKNYVSLGAEF